MGHGDARNQILKRILIIPASYPPVLGGVQTVAHRLACHRNEQGDRLEVLTRRFPRKLPAEEVIDGVRVHRRMFFPPAGDSVRRLRPDLAVAAWLCHSFDQRACRRILETLQPDIVNIHFPDWQVGLIPLIRSGVRTRLVVSLHGDEVMRAARGDGGQRDRLVAALKAADRVTACSGWLLEQADRLEPGVGDKSSVIWNGFDAHLTDSAEPMIRPRPYILGFGRFVGKKGFDLLVDAYAGLQTECDLVLVGSGPERVRLTELAEKRALSDRVVFPGRASPEDMVRWILGARVVVVPSREEPFGMAALEVVGAGIPLVATAVGGMSEFLEPLINSSSQIRLIDADVGSIRNAVEDLLKIRPEPAGRALQVERVRDQFGWARRLLDYDEAFAAAEAS